MDVVLGILAIIVVILAVVDIVRARGESLLGWGFLWLALEHAVRFVLGLL